MNRTTLNQSKTNNLVQNQFQVQTNLAGSTHSSNAALSSNIRVRRSASQSQTKSATPSYTRLEAESLKLSTYRSESNSSASNSKLISLSGGGKTEKGKATGTFKGSAGIYDVVLAYYDENDGVSKITTRIDGKTLTTVTPDKNLGNSGAIGATQVRQTIATNVTLKQGASIEISGEESRYEHARVDYIDFVLKKPSSTPSPTPPLTPTPSPKPAPVTSAPVPVPVKPTPVTSAPTSGKPNPNNLIFVNDFEDGNFTGNGQWKGFYTERPNEKAIQVVGSPAGTGKAARFELNRNDKDVAGSRRSELFSPTTDTGALSNDRWYGFRIFIPQDWQADPNSSDIITQWHEYPDFDLGEGWRSPPLYLRARGDNFEVLTRWDSRPKTLKNTPEGSATLWQGAYKRGQWSEIVFHTKFSYKSDGLTEMWLDGKKAFSHKGPNYYNDAQGPYFKTGIYKADWKWSPSKSSVNNARVLYVDEVRVGNENASYTDVAPSSYPGV